MNCVQPHGAGPRGAHGLARAHAILQHLQRMQELVAEHVLAASEVGLRGERLDGIVGRAMARRRRSRGPRWRARTGVARRVPARSWRALRRASLQRLALLAELGEIGRRQILGRRLRELGLALELLPGSTRSGSVDPARRPARPDRRWRAMTPMPAASGHSCSRKCRNASDPERRLAGGDDEPAPPAPAGHIEIRSLIGRTDPPPAAKLAWTSSCSSPTVPRWHGSPLSFPARAILASPKRLWRFMRHCLAADALPTPGLSDDASSSPVVARGPAQRLRILSDAATTMARIARPARAQAHIETPRRDALDSLDHLEHREAPRRSRN